MPEIAEVARIVHYLKKYAAGRSIKAVKATEDTIVYGKVGTSASEFEKAMKGKKIIDAKQQGKYFWLEMESPPHPLLHFGMSGWMKFSNDETAYYRPAKKDEEQEWPPKYWKFNLELEGQPDVQLAFVDARRLARIRLVEAKAEDMRKTTPLVENGPDPVIDKDILTVEWLSNLLKKKKVPVKALLLNQANISGIGNWVGDEIMYQAKLHPEQYSNTFTDAQVKKLHDAMMYVCDTAVEANAESDKFPKDWLMKHRWGKGKKDGGKLPTGEKITFLTVGGRTSAIVPSVQKKTGATAADNLGDDDGADDDEEPKPKKSTKRKSKAKEEEADDEESEEKLPVSTKRGRGRKAAEQAVREEGEDEEAEEKLPVRTKRSGKKKVEEVKTEEEHGDGDQEETPKLKKQKMSTSAVPRKPAAAKAKVKTEVSEATEAVNGRRRSGRASKS